MSQTFEILFEYLNYGLAAIGLLIVWFVRRQLWKSTQKRYEALLQSIGKESPGRSPSAPVTGDSSTTGGARS